MQTQRFSKAHGLQVLICLGFLAVCGLATSENAPQRELRVGKTEVRGSQDYRETVESFFQGETPKIVGGKVAPDGAYTWQVALLVSWIAEPSRAHFCGG